MSLLERFLGFFVDGKLVVVVLVGLVVVLGLRAAPFDVGPAGAWLAPDPVPVDAIPDTGENQQIVFTEWPGRSPRDVEDQVTYPLASVLLGISGVRTVRSNSMLGFSSIYVVFDDGVDLYFARERILEKLASLPSDLLPDGVSPSLGPDATAVGQVFWYTLEGRDARGRAAGGFDLHELRSIQDFVVRPALAAIEGVTEVSSIGGQVREYQVDVDPDALRAQGVTLDEVTAAVRASNLDVGARTIEINGAEYVVRGVGTVRTLEDLGAVVVAMREGTPIRVRDVAHVHLGPAERRGGLDDAGAEAVGGVVVARHGENAAAVIARVREAIERLAPSLPARTLEDGTESRVHVVPFYDRAQLIRETIDTLTTALWQEILVTVLVVLVMLRNLRSSLLISAIVPLGVLLALAIMRATGVGANIMALGGIAIAIGTMVDMGIVLAENITQHLERAGEGDRSAVIKRAAAEVAPAVLTSTATTIVSFLPVLALTDAELRLFGPLALTKTFVMTGALVLALIVLPAMAAVVLRRPPERAPEGSGLRRVTASVLRTVHLRDWALVALGALLVRWNAWAGLFVVLLGVFRLARPLLSERAGARTVLVENALAIAGVTLALARDWLPLGPGRGVLANTLFVALVLSGVLVSFRILEAFYPRLLRACLARKAAFSIVPGTIVAVGLLAWLGAPRLLGWAPEAVRASAPVAALGRAFPGLGREYMPSFDEGAFLYMPSSMPHASAGYVRESLSAMDAAIAAIPEVDRVVGKWGRAESALDPAPVSMIETIVTYVPEYRTEPDGTRVRAWRDHIRTPDDIWDEIVRAGQHPGFTSAPQLMPIETRLVMLQSGLRATMGIEVRGPDLASIDAFGLRLEQALREVPELRSETVFADRVVAKPYLEIHIDREAIARYGLTVEAVQQTLSVAIGGVPLTRTIEGRERYAVRVRYMREERDGVEAIGRVMVPAPGGEQIPLEQLAELRYMRGPEMIRGTDTFPTSYVLFEPRRGVAEVDAVEAAQRALRALEARGDLARPPGVTYDFVGSYRNQLRSEERLAFLVPVALALVLLILYLQFRRGAVALIVYSGVIVTVGGAFTWLWLYDQPWFLDFTLFGASMRELFQVGTVNLSVAVWIGLIALIGIATDDGVVMSTYLEQRFGEGPPRTREDVRERVVEAALRRVRPCLMTTATTILALVPVLTSAGRGADVMMPMALVVLGGMTFELFTLFLVPVLYCWVEETRAFPVPPEIEKTS